MRKIIVGILLPLFLFSCGLYKPDPITSVELEAHVTALAADSMEGRLFGTPGIVRAENYIAGEFKDYGLLPAASVTGTENIEAFFLPFTLGPGFWETREPLAVIRRNAGHNGQPDRREAFYFDYENYPLPGTTMTGENGIHGEIVFAGYGIDAKEYDYNDYKDLDVRGKIVLAFRYEPGEDDPHSVFEGRRHSKYSTFLYKMQTAKRKGAVGFITFNNPRYQRDKHPYAPPPGIAGSRKFPDAGKGGIPGVFLSEERIMNMYPSVQFNQVQKDIDAGGSIPKLPPADGSIFIRRSDTSAVEAGRNVAAYVPSRGNIGGRFEAEEHLIVIGAHHDHLGMLTDRNIGDKIFNGADDNGSGVAAVLELAEYFYRCRLPVGLIFVTFSAEELGLFGARAILEDLPELKEKALAMINFDMIGRNPHRNVTVQYSGPDRFKALLEAHLTEEYELIRKREGMQGYISDSHIFSTEGIPTVFFFTGSHGDYHMPSDEADLLLYPRMQKITETAAVLIKEIAHEETR